MCVVEAGLSGGILLVGCCVRPRDSYASSFVLAVGVGGPLIGGCCSCFGMGAGGVSRTGDSGGGGMSVPSVKE